VVQHLVQQGADKNKANNNGATPLYVAAEEGHLAVVLFLVEQGAD
jgi:ankyrin repeat protein